MPRPARARPRWCIRGASARSSRPSRSSAGACSRGRRHHRAACARHEAELRLRAAEQNLARLDDVINQLAGQIDALKRQARQAIRYRAVAAAGAQGRGDAVSSALGGRQRRACAAEQAKNGAVRWSPSAPASRPRHPSARRLRQPSCRRCARARPARRRPAASGDGARDPRARGSARQADGWARPRLVQLDDDIARERRLAADAQAALARLAAEERCAPARGQRQRRAARRSTSASRAPMPCLQAAEKAGDEATGALAELSARRHALEGAAREHAGADRLTDEITAVSAALTRLGAEVSARADLAALAAAAEHRAAAAKRKPQPCAPRRSTPPRVKRSTSCAARLPRPSGAPSGSTPKPGRWPSSCTSTPGTCGPR